MKHRLDGLHAALAATSDYGDRKAVKAAIYACVEAAEIAAADRG